MNHLERERSNHARTRNQRLAALDCFFAYLARLEPQMLREAERVAAIPRKLATPGATHFLERDQLEGLFARLPATGALALRDRALLLLLYNTGARVQEVADLRLANVQLQPPPRLQLKGKGGKWRSCPLWGETAQLLEQLLASRPGKTNAADAVFTSRRGEPLTRFGIYKIVRRHTASLEAGPGGTRRPVSPHILRHTTAIHLLEAGVELNVIRSWLGHASLDTTNRYAQVTIGMKQEALKLCQPPTSSAGFPPSPIWRDDAALLNWLESL